MAALSALLDDDDRIHPIVHVRREDEEAIKEMLSAFPNVDLTGIRSETDHGAVVELTYADQNTRIEQQTGFMDPITPADVEFALHADAFVCVPITDYEVGQATLAYIKATAPARSCSTPTAPPAPWSSAASASAGCGSSATRGCRTSTSSR